MKKLLIIGLALATVFIWSQSPQTDTAPTLGYCPTVESYAESIAESQNYDLVRYSSTSQVLNSLQNKEIDLGLVGRKKFPEERYTDLNEKIIDSSYTLVSDRKHSLDYNNLAQLEIVATKETIAETKLPVSAELIEKNKSKTVNNAAEGGYSILNWKDLNSEISPVIVMEGQKKHSDFRGLFLYY